MKIDGHFYKPIDLRYVGIVRRRPAGRRRKSSVPTNRLEMEVEAGRDHMAVVVETFIFDVLVSRINAL